MRLVRDDDAPAQPDGSAFRFGLQDDKGQIHEAARDSNGRCRFDFELQVKEGAYADRPVFTGPFASGPRDERFVYLSWQRPDGQGYVNRIKARLKDIDWALVRAAQSTGRPLEADMSGRKAGGGTTPVDWRLAAE
jgi:hypothetical protein